MKFQTVYQTNADYSKTLEKLRTHPSVGFVDPDYSSKGHLCFKFKNSDHVVELVKRTGQLLVTWGSKEEKGRLYPLLWQVLATRNGEPLEIRPVHTTVYRVPYPPPRGFQLSYCSESIQYLGIHARELGALKATLVFIPILVGLGLIALESRRRRELRLRHEEEDRTLDHKTVNGENFRHVCDSCFYHHYDVSQTWKHLYNIGGVSCFDCGKPATRWLKKQESCQSTGAFRRGA